MDWSNKRVLVTGAGGFIGSHLAELLVMQGARVRAFIRYNSRGDPGLLQYLPADVFSNIEIIAGDLRDPQAVENAVSESQYVFHLGALISIPYSYIHPYEVAETNLLGTVNVLLACKKAGIERLIHTSSSEVYGTAQFAPIHENHPLQGQSPYSASKIGADKLAESFFCAYGLPVVTVRPFNTYGPRQSTRAVIPSIITQAIRNRKIFIGNVDTSRDFTFVSDTVAGFMCAAESVNAVGKTINLGTGVEIRIKDLIDLIIQLIDPSIPVEQDLKRMRPEKSEVFRLISDNSLARSILGWQPEVNLKDGIKKTIDWIGSNLAHYQMGKHEV